MPTPAIPASPLPQEDRLTIPPPDDQYRVVAPDAAAFVGALDRRPRLIADALDLFDTNRAVRPALDFRVNRNRVGLEQLAQASREPAFRIIPEAGQHTVCFQLSIERSGFGLWKNPTHLGVGQELAGILRRSAGRRRSDC